MTKSSNVLLILKIYHHNNIMAKLGILVFVMTILRKNLEILKHIEVNYLRLHDSAARRIKHETSDMFTYCEKSSNLVRSRFFISQPAITPK